eukprot:TRINITY_DN11506_c0_g1_i1.p1 TRINITY_DN11506_c0_g1~~TRINITY_DN11506_c0_g1_i1.p1  ORF type:complete len:610 (+),score=183.57 TRINITY_DN11506_c0_g1_i1:97-1830(+)
MRSSPILKGMGVPTQAAELLWAMREPPAEAGKPEHETFAAAAAKIMRLMADAGADTSQQDEARCAMRACLLRFAEQTPPSEAANILRYTQCLLKLHARSFAQAYERGACPAPTSEQLLANSMLNFLTREDFARSWKSLVLRRCALTEPASRERLQWDISLQLAEARRTHGDGKRLEHAAKDAEAGPAMRRLSDLEKRLMRCIKGQRIVRIRVVDEEKRERILQEKETDIQSLRDQITELQQRDPEYLAACRDIEAYQRYLTVSNTGHLLRARESLANTTPWRGDSDSSSSGSDRGVPRAPECAGFVSFLRSDVKPIGPAFEEEAEVVVRFLQARRAAEEEAEKGRVAEHHILSSVSLKCNLPQKASGEIDHLVVEREEIAVGRGGAGAAKYRVTRIIAWYEVKVNPDDVMSACSGHCRAKEFLEGLDKEVRCSRNKDYLFPTHLFRALGECPVTFITLAGPGPVLRGSRVPFSMMCPPNIAQTFVQYALDVHAPSSDPAVLTTDFSYIDALYDRLGEFMLPLRYASMTAEETAAAASSARAGFMSDLVRVLRTADEGKILVLPDPFLGAYMRKAENP